MTYPVRWGKYQILRDFIQNFYDSVDKEMWYNAFQYSYSDNRLTMKIENNCFSYEWLLHIGASTKTNASIHSAGYYGEGFKMASLCAIRDCNWQVTMKSGNWQIDVVTTKKEIDNIPVEMLGYELEEREAEKNSELTLYPLSKEDFELFKKVLYSFYYPENPLLGDVIYEGNECAVYYRSEEKYPDVDITGMVEIMLE